jgi:hypothetical protein
VPAHQDDAQNGDTEPQRRHPLPIECTSSRRRTSVRPHGVSCKRLSCRSKSQPRKITGPSRSITTKSRKRDLKGEGNFACRKSLSRHAAWGGSAAGGGRIRRGGGGIYAAWADRWASAAAGRIHMHTARIFSKFLCKGMKVST